MVQTIKVLWLAALTLTSHAALAGTRIEQAIDMDSDGQRTHTLHTWSIDGSKFALEVKTGRDTTQYLFNGRTFYACGKLSAAQLKAAQQLTDASALEPYKDGACQVVPTNFMVRFFLAPLPSAQSVEASDGLKLTLTVHDYQVQKKGGLNEAGTPCSNEQRKYTVQKKGDAVSKGASIEVDEELCIAAAPNWRAGLWPEIAKAVVRQPRGGELLRQLKKDLQDGSGMALRAKTIQRSSDAQGKVQVRQFALHTLQLREAEFPAKMFGLPAGYKVFSPESLSLSTAALRQAKAKAATGSDEHDVFDVMRSVFFCAITGQLGCLVAP